MTRNYINELENTDEIEQATTIFEQYKLSNSADSTLCNALDVLLLIDQNVHVRCTQRVLHAALRMIRDYQAK